jgi:hypothetical protein
MRSGGSGPRFRKHPAGTIAHLFEKGQRDVLQSGQNYGLDSSRRVSTYSAQTFFCFADQVGFNEVVGFFADAFDLLKSCL